MRSDPRFFGLLDMALFAERLRQLRTERKLTQGRMAEILGVSLRMYCRWEAAEAMPYTDTLVKIANALQVSADELLGREAASSERKIHNLELHQLYQQVDQLNDEDQQALIILLDSLVKRSKVRRVMGEERPVRKRVSAQRA